jgi:uncharacterized membrane protein YphA (DoxX/SURF4 family)
MQEIHLPNLPPGYLGWLALGAVVILFASMFAQRRPEGERINVFGKFFLVMLRLTIGWHCLVEGMEKLHNPGWSSEPYLREATGPLGPKFREMAGDRVLDQLAADDKKLPPDLDADWQRYFDAFVVNYKLDDAQKTKAAEALEKAKQATVEWLAKPHPVPMSSIVEPKVTEEYDVKKRIKDYKEARAKADELEAELMTRYYDAAEQAEAYLKDKGDRPGERFRHEKVWQGKVWAEWLAFKKLAADERASLKKDIDGQTAAMKGALAKASALTDDQKKMSPVDEPIRRPIDWSNELSRSDAIVSYGLVVVGGCLILGFFTPVACIAGAVFLAMFYLAMPAFPWLPESPRAEGHYLYVNKNIIEMFALLALACLPTGRWAGLDALLRFLIPFRRRKDA